MSQSGLYGSSGGGGGGSLNTLTGNSGGAISPSAGNINIVGSGGVTVTGNAGTHTLTITSAGGGITTLDGDAGSATGATVTIHGGSNISTSAAASTVTVNLVNSPSVSGSVTAGTGFSATTGDVAIVAGNLDLPLTNAALTEGVINVGGIPQIQFLGDDGAGQFNIFIGSSAGNGTLTQGTAVANIGIGIQALNHITTGDSNLGIGLNAGNAITTGTFNHCLGYEGNFSVTTGTHNVAVGTQSNLFGTTGSYNLVIGVNQSASAYNGAESSNIIINNAGVNGESNTMRIGTTGAGNGQVNACYIAGIFGSTVDVGSGIAVVVDNTGKLGTVISSERFKDRITDMGERSSRVMQLRPVNFAYKNDEMHTIQYGLIAEEVAKVMPELVAFDIMGVPYSVRYHDMPAILLNELQKQQSVIKDLSQKLSDVMQRLEALESKGAQ